MADATTSVSTATEKAVAGRGVQAMHLAGKLLLVGFICYISTEISKDFTGGYGPEEYTVRRAMAGEYQIKANFFGSRAQQVTGPTTCRQPSSPITAGRPSNGGR